MRIEQTEDGMERVVMDGGKTVIYRAAQPVGQPTSRPKKLEEPADEPEEVPADEPPKRRKKSE